ncbi:unnamed protein product (macronuclear) [Paramecium tetraurelia]|uniref:PUM-HD domain-containing protein n=1 Tax=Paramecium tetraurelia TaxID=5888 RepID=A0CQK6_PARTE|nr:uncharacterized protein GSPATT00009421001 [Paramecium tetraurelia]CAK73073.1 unnamed protein product [Paramecium tetraurelia]|eukprot:XP_001440470.1 hypothetical protein (macronuclear) [Paramecium tetraurelia strain d4-2]
MANPHIPVEFNKDDDELKCHPSQSGSTATPTLFENPNNSKAFCSQFFEDQLHQDDDEFDELNQQLNQVLLNDSFKPSLTQAFTADMSSYLSHEKLTKNSRKMQQEYQNATLREKDFVFNTYIKNDIENFSLDKYRHYILEKIIEVGPPSHRNLILNRIYNQIHKLIKDLYACKVMQKGLEVMVLNPQDSMEQLENYLSFIHQDNIQMKKIYVDKIANQIIQKSLEILEGNNLLKLLQNLSKYILSNNNEKFELSTDQYGCLIVNKIIDIYPKQFDAQTKSICNNIIVRAIENCSCLTRRQYANYIIQQILEKGQEVHKRLLIDQYLIKDFISMSLDKYGSNVAEKAIIYAGPQWRLKLWEEEVSISESSFKKLVNDQFANYPIQRLFEYLDQQQRNEFIALLNKLHGNNQLNNHGQIVMKFAQANYSIKRYTQKIVQSELSKNNKNQDNKGQKNQKQSQNQQSPPLQMQQQQQSLYQQQMQQMFLQQQSQFKQFDQQQYQAAVMQQMLIFQQQQQQLLTQMPQLYNQDMNYMPYPIMTQEQQMMMLRWIQQQQQLCNANIKFQNGQQK